MSNEYIPSPHSIYSFPSCINHYFFRLLHFIPLFLSPPTFTPTHIQPLHNSIPFLSTLFFYCVLLLNPYRPLVTPFTPIPFTPLSLHLIRTPFTSFRSQQHGPSLPPPPLPTNPKHFSPRFPPLVWSSGLCALPQLWPIIVCVYGVPSSSARHSCTQWFPCLLRPTSRFFSPLLKPAFGSR